MTHAAEVFASILIYAVFAIPLLCVIGYFVWVIWLMIAVAFFDYDLEQ